MEQVLEGTSETFIHGFPQPRNRGFLQEFEGMLRKQGHDIMGSYSDRWCVLKRNVLTYYKKPNTPELGALPLEVSLHRCTVCHCV